ncbi:MAG: bifunctional folylpolyglutamate synthase/dihydrofolate synthase, partial [Ardenticatenaceae bacterium]
MTYQATLDYIWNLVNFETKPPATRGEYKLDRMRALMAQLGNPQERLRAVHIAGTKGKGSTAAMIERVLRAAGYRSALYSSPHLHDPRERMRIVGNPISEEEFVALVERLRPAIEADNETTTFEALTAMAFVWFAESHIEVAVLEVGLGGRLDATNLVAPLLSVITPLSLEHTAVLGNTLAEIATEKGGIVKPGVPVVVAAQLPDAMQVLRRIAAKRDAPLTVAGDHWQVTRTAVSLAGQRFSIAEWGVGSREWGSECEILRECEDLELPLLGAHQVENAVVAIAALEALREQGIAWDEAALREGLARVEWPARVEVVRRYPLVVVDGAHTRESAAALVTALREAMPGGWGEATLVLGVSSDKDVGVLVEVLAPLADHVILTRSRHPRAADPAALASHPALSIHGVRI